METREDLKFPEKGEETIRENIKEELGLFTFVSKLDLVNDTLEEVRKSTDCTDLNFNQKKLLLFLFRLVSF